MNGLLNYLIHGLALRLARQCSFTLKKKKKKKKKIKIKITW